MAIKCHNCIGYHKNYPLVLKHGRKTLYIYNYIYVCFSLGNLSIYKCGFELSIAMFDYQKGYL